MSVVGSSMPEATTLHPLVVLEATLQLAVDLSGCRDTSATSPAACCPSLGEGRQMLAVRL